MEFLDERLSAYAEAFTTAESAALATLNRETWAKVMMPRMLSGHLQGRFLSFLSHLIKPSNALEIGTYTGYSAICMAEGLSPNGVLHTIDVNEELEAFVKKHIELAGMGDRIKLHIGAAAEVILSIKGDFDLVFIDADKENYGLYFDMVIDRVRPGGVMIADNVLWSGKVIDEKELSKDKETQALHAFNAKVHADNRVENLLLPVRDGLMMLRKR